MSQRSPEKISERPPKKEITLMEEGALASEDELKREHPQLFEAKRYLMEVNRELDGLLVRGATEEVIKEKLAQMIDKLKEELQRGHFRFQVQQNDSPYLGEARRAISACIQINNVEAVLDFLDSDSHYLDRIDIYLQADALIKRARSRIVELRGKIVTSLEKNDERVKRMSTLLSDEITAQSQKEIARLTSEADRDTANMKEWQGKINRLEMLIGGLLDAIAGGSRDLMDVNLAMLSSHFGQYTPPSSIRSTLETHLTNASEKVEYVAHYPTVKEKLPDPEIEKGTEVRSSRLKIALIFAGAVAVVAGAGGMTYGYLKARGGDEKAQVTQSKKPMIDQEFQQLMEKDPSDPRLKEAKKRVISYLKRNGVPKGDIVSVITQSTTHEKLFQRSFVLIKQIKGQLATQELDGKQVVSPKHIVVGINPEVHELSEIVFESEVGTTMTLEKGTILHGQTPEGYAVLNRKQYCQDGKLLFIKADPQAVEYQTTENPVSQKERLRVCSEVRQALVRELGLEAVQKDDKDATVLFPILHNILDFPSAKKELRRFMLDMQRRGLFPKESSTAPIDKVSQFRDLEAGLVEIFRGDVYHTEKEKKTIMFSVRPEFEEGVQILYGSEVQIGIAHEAHLKNLPKQDNFMTGIGVPLSTLCLPTYSPNLFNIVIRPKIGDTPSVHNVPIDRYIGRYCKN